MYFERPAGHPNNQREEFVIECQNARDAAFLMYITSKASELLGAGATDPASPLAAVEENQRFVHHEALEGIATGEAELGFMLELGRTAMELLAESAAALTAEIPQGYPETDRELRQWARMINLILDAKVPYFADTTKNTYGPLLDDGTGLTDTTEATSQSPIIMSIIPLRQTEECTGRLFGIGLDIDKSSDALGLMDRLMAFTANSSDSPPAFVTNYTDVRISHLGTSVHDEHSVRINGITISSSELPNLISICSAYLELDPQQCTEEELEALNYLMLQASFYLTEQ